MQDLHDFLLPIDRLSLNDDNSFNDGQLGTHIISHEKQIPDISDADVVLIGINEARGSGQKNNEFSSADAVRKELYQLHYWHKTVVLADWGNVVIGHDVADSYAALKTVIREILDAGKIAVVIGGSHDLTLAQYAVYKDLNRPIEAVCVDALINLKGDSNLKSDHFLLDMLTTEPNMVKHYNHIGFQSYFVHPRLLETMDKLRFDCYRLGIVKEDIDEMEPVFRNAHLASFDISAIKNSDAPANKISPNGFNGEEACRLSQFAGQSTNINSFGIYGYNAHLDMHQLTAKQIAQMIWYFIDGVSKRQHEPDLNNLNHFNEFHTFFSEIDTLFLQSKRSGRWWMQLPDKQFIACSQKDYVKASNNQIPERWMRYVERSL